VLIGWIPEHAPPELCYIKLNLRGCSSSENTTIFPKENSYSHSIHFSLNRVIYQPYTLVAILLTLKPFNGMFLVEKLSKYCFLSWVLNVCYEWSVLINSCWENGGLDLETVFDMSQQGDWTIFHLSSDRWITEEWEHCTKTCGSLGYHIRTVRCVQFPHEGTNRSIHSKFCSGEKPEIRRACNRIPCPAQWRTGAWSEVLFSQVIWCFEAINTKALVV